MLLIWRSPSLAVFAIAAWLAIYGLVLSFVDAGVHRRLPDRLMWRAFVGSIAILTVDAVVSERAGRPAAAARGGLLLGLVYHVQPQSMAW
ncbi:MAG TPA: hypothetical protein VFC19_29600 [Candidatus Limnocylindrales bacterium]|nr:hypothetical protein [Candidatus Limnocylindrales bacterium]